MDETQTIVALTMQSGRQHIILVDIDSMEKIIPDFSNFDISKTGLTSIDSRISLMGQEVLSRQNPKNQADTEFYLAGWNFATFLDRVASFESLADFVKVTSDGRVELKYKEAKAPLPKEVNSIIKIEDKLGQEHYIVAKNVDIDKVFAGVYSDSSPIAQITSESPSAYLIARAVDYNDLGDGQLTGMYFLTKTNLAMFMNNFESMQVIRNNVSIDSHGYIVGGAD